jgi:hypothetical protein
MANTSIRNCCKSLFLNVLVRWYKVVPLKGYMGGVPPHPHNHTHLPALAKCQKISLL